MSTVALLLAALALVAWPGLRRTPAAGPEREGRVQPPEPIGHAQRDRLLAPAAGVGASVVSVMIGGVPAGIIAAVAVGPAAAVAVQWLRRRPRKLRPDRSLALCLDLVSAVLRSGRPLASALDSAAPSTGPATAAALTRVARLLALGAEPRDAWRWVAPPGSPLEPVAAVAVRSHASGIKLADAFERLAADLRSDCAATAAARAERAGVHAMGPLAACFLPSFVCLGIVPVVVGVATTVTGTLG